MSIAFLQYCDTLPVVKKSFELAFSMSTIQNRFLKFGVFPFNPNVVNKAKMVYKPFGVYWVDT